MTNIKLPSIKLIPASQIKIKWHSLGYFVIMAFLGVWSAKGANWFVKGGFIIFLGICISIAVTGCASNTAKNSYKDAFDKFHSGDYIAAINAFDKAITTRPQDSVLYNSRGAAKRRSGDSQGAIEDYNKAIKINPKYEEALINRGMAKSYLEDAKGAASDFSEAIEINPRNSMAYYNRGVVRHDMEDTEGAISDWSNAIEIDPKYADAYLNRGIAKETLGNLRDACADWQKAADLGLRQPARWIEQQCGEYRH
tara:strand:+ start:724 stop:1482 length:759 start_codon:yes stop_codon:yes gene_type:complete